MAIVQQPSQFVDRDLRFARVEHPADFIQIQRPLKRARRMNELPLRTRPNTTNAKTTHHEECKRFVWPSRPVPITGWEPRKCERTKTRKFFRLFVLSCFRD